MRDIRHICLTCIKQMAAEVRFQTTNKEKMKLSLGTSSAAEQRMYKQKYLLECNEMQDQKSIIRHGYFLRHIAYSSVFHWIIKNVFPAVSLVRRTGQESDITNQQLSC